MSKHLQISIADPCHENWDNMAPADKGRFCDSCQKQVVDFTSMSDRQIAEFFKKPSTGSLCGRFMSDQLERSIEIPKKRIPWLRYFFQFAIPAFLFSMKATAQGVVKAKLTTSPTQKPTCTPMMGTMAAPVHNKPIDNNPIDNKPIHNKQLLGDTTIVKALQNPELLGDIVTVAGGIGINREKPKPVKTPIANSILVKGRVVDEDGDPIPQATILEVDSKKMLASDDLGYFGLTNGRPGDLIQLEVSSVGYKTEVFNYPIPLGYTSAVNYSTPVPWEVNITIQLKPEPKDMPEVVVTTLEGPRMGHFLGSITKVETITSQTKKDSTAAKEIKPVIEVKEIIPSIGENKMLVFPNPASSGTQLNISFKEHEEGYYLLQLLSQSGQLVHQKEIWIGQETGITRFDLPFVAAGSYFLVATNKKSEKKFTEKIIVQ